jgi:hypothetical protein
LQAAALQGTTTPPPTGGSATLTWAKPTKNTNGTPLTDLSGYKVYWGKAPGAYSNSFIVSNPASITYKVSGLGSGTWYFVVTSLAGGRESAQSNVASKTLP